MNKEELGNKIREERIKKGYSLSDMADLLKINKSTLSRYETEGISNLEVLTEITDFLNIDMKSILFNEKIETKTKYKYNKDKYAIINLDNQETDTNIKKKLQIAINENKSIYVFLNDELYNDFKNNQHDIPMKYNQKFIDFKRNDNEYKPFKKAYSYNPLMYINSDEEAINFVDFIIKESNCNTDIKPLLLAIILYITKFKIEIEQNISSIVNLLYKSKIDINNPTAKTELDNIFEKLASEHSDDFAVYQYNIYSLYDANRKTQTLLDCLNVLSAINTDGAKKVLNPNNTFDISLNNIKYEITYVLMPDENSPFKLLYKLFVYQLFDIINKQYINPFKVDFDKFTPKSINATRYKVTLKNNKSELNIIFMPIIDFDGITKEKTVILCEDKCGTFFTEIKDNEVFYLGDVKIDITYLPDNNYIINFPVDKYDNVEIENIQIQYNKINILCYNHKFTIYSLVAYMDNRPRIVYLHNSANSINLAHDYTGDSKDKYLRSQYRQFGKDDHSYCFRYKNVEQFINMHSIQNLKLSMESPLKIIKNIAEVYVKEASDKIKNIENTYQIKINYDFLFDIMTYIYDAISYYHKQYMIYNQGIMDNIYLFCQHQINCKQYKTDLIIPTILSGFDNDIFLDEYNKLLSNIKEKDRVNFLCDICDIIQMKIKDIAPYVEDTTLINCGQAGSVVYGFDDNKNMELYNKMSRKKFISKLNKLEKIILSYYETKHIKGVYTIKGLKYDIERGYRGCKNSNYIQLLNIFCFKDYITFNYYDKELKELLDLFVEELFKEEDILKYYKDTCESLLQKIDQHLN